MGNHIIQEVSAEKNSVRISVLNVPDVPGIAAKLFTYLSDENINIDMIIQNISTHGEGDISFIISQEDLKKATFFSEKILTPIGAKGLTIDENIVKISLIFKSDMKFDCKVAAKMFAALSQKKINIQMISAAETKISVIVDSRSSDTAISVIQDAFETEKK